jgi:hypothetical protein
LIGDRFAHFEVVGGLPQPVNWKSDIFGVFLQAASCSVYIPTAISVLRIAISDRRSASAHLFAGF